jgi:hypothetical protein
MLECVHFSGHGRSMKCPIGILLPIFSYIASSVRSCGIVHKDRPVGQWMIIKMGYNRCAKHIVVVCNAIDVIFLKHVSPTWRSHHDIQWLYAIGLELDHSLGTIKPTFVWKMDSFPIMIISTDMIIWPIPSSQLMTVVAVLSVALRSGDAHWAVCL